MLESRNIHRQETLIYLVLWTALFMAPVFSILVLHSGTDAAGYDWSQLWRVWKQFSLLLAAFLIHDFLLAPLLVYKQKYLLYFALAALLMGSFVMVQCTSRPEPPRFADKEMPHDMPPEPRPLPMKPHDMPPDIFAERDVITTIFLFLILGMNLGLKSFFRQREDQQRLALLEKENLEQQLQYLRYQINPHFLMNTLNNIHALVDIDPERAKETIVELSKLMRYALYDGSRQTVALRLDVAFLQSYIHLMRLRYTDKVAITVSLPPHLPELELPPMLFITFVENAFKHGVSYQQPSFIEISLGTTPTSLAFRCRNSKAPRQQGQQGGVGLQNVKRRLQLIYGNSYTLHISDGSAVYDVSLEIPLKTDTI